MSFVGWSSDDGYRSPRLYSGTFSLFRPEAIFFVGYFELWSWVLLYQSALPHFGHKESDLVDGRE